ncbi:alpha/beta fold hydrolase [Amycolatopsis nigrescens]|uniref:alpha/beta fold hydrolase n=1 Tax=Amycolatopsis nigrescens TaxID=381445 RepID=UPI00035CE72E|nr:alpha/beta hydrolase [Amycolatopsis nigrescens]
MPAAEQISAVCAVEGAELHVQRTGEGPPLLLIAGGLGSADGFRFLAKDLSSEYTVLSYDRRGHYRSTDHGSGPITVARQAADARAVIEHFGFPSAAVFGSSAGAQIGLELVTAHPGVVKGLVAHEPPAVRLLPDAEQWLAFNDEQVAVARSGDLLGAFLKFVGSISGAALPELRAVRLPNQDEWRLLFDREITEFYSYLPDIAALRRTRVPVLPVAGRDSRGYYHYRPARTLALELGMPFEEMPGAHLAPQRNPADFAAVLKELLLTVPI